MDTAICDAFIKPGKWYKGNLHSHSTASDGSFSPEELADCYREKGYDFIAITDHNKFLDPGYKFRNKDILAIPGVEFDFHDILTGKYFHMVGLGFEGELKLPDRVTVQNAVSMIRARGGHVIIPHPYWMGLTINDLAPLGKILGIEVFNKIATEVGRGYSTVHWDDLLTSGKKVWGLAVDDTHYSLSRFGGWIMLKASSLDLPSVMKSLSLGHFYATQGPEFYDISVRNGVIAVKCGPVSNIYFIGANRRGRNEAFCRSYEENRDYESVDSVFTGAEYKIRGTEQYIRVEIMDSKGKWAWSNPIFLD